MFPKDFSSVSMLPFSSQNRPSGIHVGRIHAQVAQTPDVQHDGGNLSKDSLEHPAGEPIQKYAKHS